MIKIKVSSVIRSRLIPVFVLYLSLHTLRTLSIRVPRCAGKLFETLRRLIFVIRCGMVYIKVGLLCVPITPTSFCFSVNPATIQEKLHTHTHTFRQRGMDTVQSCKTFTAYVRLELCGNVLSSHSGSKTHYSPT